jgi:hypothetical protein
MSDEELVKRLRSYAKDQGGWHNIDDTCEEAADRIEALKDARDTMTNLWVKEASDKQVALGRIEALTVRVEKSEAALKEAVGFLAEADRRIIWEGLGFGNDFADSVDAFLAKHGEQP